MDEEVIWKPIPGYSGYEASSHGGVRTEKGLVLSQHEAKTTKGSYLNVAVYRDNKTRHYTGVHRLVCLAFHGEPPPGTRWDTNHKDGDKHNNYYLNLEWMSRSDNVKHAYRTGLNKFTVKVKVLDHYDKTERVYNSVFEMEHDMGINVGEGHNVIRKYHTVKYLDRYTFIKSEYNPPAFKRNVGLYMVDFINHKFIQAPTITQMAYITKYNPSSIRNRLKGRGNGLINGCFFGFKKDEQFFDKVRAITTEQVDASVRLYNEAFGDKYKKNSKGVIVKDYINGQTLEFSTIPMAAAHLGLSLGSIRSYLDRGYSHLFKGYVFRLKEDTRPFKDYPQSVVELSLTCDIANGKPISVTDLNSNTTKCYSSFAAFAKSIGKDPEPFRQRWKNGSIKEYTIEFIEID